MSKRTESIHIFHLYRKDGSAVFLHPFRNTDKLFSILEKSQVVGHYGGEPRVESLTLFRNDLYRLVEVEVKRWVSDSRFIPKFIISAAAFLLTYLFLSFVIRDPLPVLDEVAIGLGVAIVAFVLLGRRDQKSDAALKRRIALRNKVDAIVFAESEFVQRLEDALIARDEVEPRKLMEELIAGSGDLLASGHLEEAEQMVAYLDGMFTSADVKKTQKRLSRMQETSPEQDKASMQKWLEGRNVDVPLLSIYMQLKKEVKTQV